MAGGRGRTATSIHHGRKYKFSPSIALSQLELLWYYIASNQLWFEIRIIGKSARSYWFTSAKEAVEWLEKNWDKKKLWTKHVFFGVLPREKFSEEELNEKGRPRGGGKSKHVVRALYVFSDLDYKQEVELAKLSDEVRKTVEEQGYCVISESEDGGLEGYFRKDEKKAIYVKKPGVKEFLEWLKEKLDPLGIRPALVVDSGYGYHVYVKLSYDIDVSRWKKLQTMFIDYLGGDEKTKDPARILRVAGSWNPRFYPYLREVRVVHREPVLSDVDAEELEKKLSEALAKSKAAAEAAIRARRKLSEREISAVVNILKNFWISGHRDQLELGLVGWMWKAAIDYDSAYKIIEKICDEASDEEKEKRLKELERQWKLFESGSKKKKEILGKTGVLEELEKVFKEQNPRLNEEEARDRAIATVSELEKILGYRRSIVIRTPYETSTWIVNDPRRGIVILKEKITDEGEVKRSRKYISDWYIKRVKISRGDGQIMYKVLFKNARTKEKLVLTGAIDEIGKELAKIHGIKRSQLVRDAVSALISEFIKRKLAKVKKTAAVAGLVAANASIKFVRSGVLSKVLVPKSPDIDKAKKALELLAKLREFYDANKFDAAVNWAGYSILSYVLKKKYNVKQVFLLLHGEKQTGKTTLARIITGLFPVVSAGEEEIPEEGQSEFRLAWKLNVSTLPLLEDEVQGISRKPSLLGLLKRASTGDVIRWRGDQNRLYHARAPLILTSNYREVIEDPALFERMVPLEFTYSDYVYSKPKEKLEEFRKIYNEYLSLSPHLGRVIIDTVVELWREIEEKWVHRIQQKKDYIEFGKWVWRKVAEKLQVSEPVWCRSDIKLEEERPEEREQEIFWELLHDVVREAILKAKSYAVAGTLADKLAALASDGLLPGWIYIRSTDCIISAGIINEIEKRYGIQIIGGLKGLAERLGYKYSFWRVPGGRRVWGMQIPLKDFDKISTPEELAREYAEKILPKFTIERRELTEENVIAALIEAGLDEESARLILPLVLQNLTEKLSEKILV